ncbi:LysR substrate-binding domain-containing protein [Ruegeria sp.]|uniref:LysR substrate-binding domain-containing protein n=1 Tax=Ruegeria sp. TaxID=1879320 RepID=UPI0023276234|nr:LysR substrate-binding domain-containing protein [Ruegeria sp.]MDA7966820.1 LysR family transcriptional regulator [Ruegeria sp.]
MAVSATKLRAFAHVYEAETFSGAAQALGNSVPSVTQLIHALEKEYGVSLFVKSGRKLVPTPAADQLYPIAFDLRETEARAEKVLQNSRLGESGTLRVGIGNAYPGMAIIQKFLSAMPSVRVDVENGNWDRIMELFKTRQIDVGILPAVRDESTLQRVVCFEQRVVAVVSESHPLCGQSRISLADLKDQPLIFRSPGSSTQYQVDAALQTENLCFKPVVLSDSRDGVLEAVANGLGIGFVWEHSSFRSDNLHRIAIDELQNQIPEHAFAASNNASTLVQAFLNICASMRSISKSG